VGQNVEKYPEIAQRIVAEGHDICNHTHSHRELVPSTKRIVESQLDKADLAIRRTTGTRTKLFRPPRGMISNAVRGLIVEKGYTIILWTASSMDWSGISPKIMVMRLRLFVRSGGIVLFHDSGALIRNEGASRGNTVQALPMVIDYLRYKRGYKIVPVSEMLDRLEDESLEPKEALEQA
jgi:peptidoglycan/xylan/chitin deacetylase (PgdA/CDA1 family)